MPSTAHCGNAASTAVGDDSPSQLQQVTRIGSRFRFSATKTTLTAFPDWWDRLYWCQRQRRQLSPRSHPPSPQLPTFFGVQCSTNRIELGENAALSIVCHRCTTFSAGRRDSLRWPLNRPATTRPAAGNAWGPAPCEARRRARQQPPHHAIAPAVAQPYGRSSAQPHSARRHASRAAPHLGEHATARLRRAHLPQNAAPPARHAPLAARKTHTCRLPLCLTHCH